MFTESILQCAEKKVEHEKRRKEMRSTLMEIAKTLSSKQDQAKAVFKPSHIMPTFSVEQAGLMELEQVRCACMRMYAMLTVHLVSKCLILIYLTLLWLHR